MQDGLTEHSSSDDRAEQGSHRVSQSGDDRASSDVDAVGVVENLRRAFKTGRTRSFRWRQQQLRGLRRLVTEREDDICAALHADFRKSPHETQLSETRLVQGEIDYTLKHLAQWMEPEAVKTPLVNQPGSSAVHREPLGVVLIIGPWNYPFRLMMSPLVGAIAAGNCALLKPSEITGATSQLIAECVGKYLDRDAIRVIEGGVEETTRVLEQRFDHIFYTGGGVVGRIVMTAAAQHLTPVTLELGGKSPCYVDRNVDLSVAARRIVWGKYLNGGQTCVAPDYLLVHKSIQRPLLERLASAIREFYGADPKTSQGFPRIVNDRQFNRLVGLLDSGDAYVGGESDAAERYIAPTILQNVSLDSPVMAEEIFGPILPVIAVDGPGEAIKIVNDRPNPLALYVFSKDKHVTAEIIERTHSGGVCVNDVVMHIIVPELPFGGVGASGIGAYNGRSSFETFSHRRGVLTKGFRLDAPLRYPPYTDSKVKWLKFLA